MPGLTQKGAISRREFLKFAGANLAVLACPRLISLADPLQEAIPLFQAVNLPQGLQSMLAKIPALYIGKDGYLRVGLDSGNRVVPVPVVRTLWNQEHSLSWNRLDEVPAWGIVLHWFGEPPDFNQPISGYMRGFDSERQIDGVLTRTSAHFLVGDHQPDFPNMQDDQKITVVQTQIPDKDGIPFIAAHALPLDILAHRERRQYFVRACYKLEQAGSGFHSLIQDMFDGQLYDPNVRSIAIEITGSRFDEPGYYPSEQKIANTVGLVWAVMRRYRIPASHIVGHHEIQLGKSDPGKQFISLIRLLLGLKALVDQDPNMIQLVFGSFVQPGGSLRQAIQNYFGFTRDYLVLVATQKEVYEWESSSKYWFIQGLINRDSFTSQLITRLSLPVQSEGLRILSRFLEPENHEGIDLFHLADRKLRSTMENVHLVANGQCVFSGKVDVGHPGHSVIFRHLEPGGSLMLTMYGNLSSAADLETGKHYSKNHLVGVMQNQLGMGDPFLHFSVAYGATWDTDLQRNAELPINAGRSWILERFVNPWDYLKRFTAI